MTKMESFVKTPLTSVNNMFEIDRVIIIVGWGDGVVWGCGVGWGGTHYVWGNG